MASDAYTPPGLVSGLRWFRTGAKWHFECQVDIKFLEYQWLQQGDLALLTCEGAGQFASLQGTLMKIRGKKPTSEDDTKSFIVEVELSKIAELTWDAQEVFLEGASDWCLRFILIPPNEKKSIQLLQDMPRSSPLQGMRLTMPRSSREMKREMEMRPLVTVDEVRMCLKNHVRSNGFYFTLQHFPTYPQVSISSFAFHITSHWMISLPGEECNERGLRRAQREADLSGAAGPAAALLHGSRATGHRQDQLPGAVRGGSAVGITTAERHIHKKV